MLEEMGWPQRKPTSIANDNSIAVGISNDTINQRRSKSMDIQFYCCQYRVSQNLFCVYWNSVNVNLGDYYSKHHSEKHHQMVRPIYLNKNNPPRYIIINVAVGMQGCVDSYQINAQIINPNRLVRHRWELPVLRYHKILVIYPYRFFAVITQLLSNIIFINYCICILTGSPG